MNPQQPSSQGQHYPPPNYPPQPYQQQPPPPPSRPTNVLAVVTLVMAFVIAPLAVPLGHIARKQIRERGEGGDVLALIGLVIGYVWLVPILLAPVALAVVQFVRGDQVLRLSPANMIVIAEILIVACVIAFFVSRKSKRN